MILKILITTFRDSSGIVIKYKMWNQSKQEYVARINRVKDYIGANLQLLNVRICNVELNKLLIMNSKIEVKQMPEMKLIYCRHMGPFN